MKIISLTQQDCLSDEETNALAATFLNKSSYKILLQDEEANVTKPNGDLLLKFRKNVLSKPARDAAYDALLDAAKPTNNRGTAAGGDRFVAVKEDGTLSKTQKSLMVRSGVAGYFDRYPRIPFCRTTAYTAENIDRFKMAYPLIEEVSDVFKKNVPSRWAAQNAKIQNTHPDFRITNTVFTTITINKNWQTAVHKDAGDLPEGFGVLSVLERGSFDGGYLVLPQFRIAARIREGDVLLYDVHEWHGNTPFVTSDMNFVRLGLVFYYRKKMEQCGSAQEELERAKRL